FATEGGAFTPEQCRRAYEPWLTATMDTYPGWSPQVVPSFFQDYTEDGLRAQVKWFVDNMGFSRPHFSDLLGLEEATLDNWLLFRGSLKRGQQDMLKKFWRLHLHLRSFYNGDITAVREMYNYVPESELHNVPWKGGSIKAYIQSRREKGIRFIQEWFESL